MKKFNVKHTLLGSLLLLILLVSIPFTAFAQVQTASNVYSDIIAMKEEYPEGTPWDNSNFYAWKGGIYSGGYGCAGFAFMLSDEVFGSLPARKIDKISYSSLRAGDILRVNNDTHSVIILKKQADQVVIAEGNFNSSVHWGRTLSKAEVLNASYYMTRYPKAASKPALTAGKQQLTVKWGKNTAVTGYEIQYSLKKSFAQADTKKVVIKNSSTVSKVIRNLKKGKTYYVRIRTYKNNSGNKYYSSWSKVLDAKVK